MIIKPAEDTLSNELDNCIFGYVHGLEMLPEELI